MSTPDDELIERAAHALTRGEPSYRLRQVVRTRIEQRRPAYAVDAGDPWPRRTQGRHFSWQQTRRVWIPATAGVAIVLAIIAGRTSFDSRLEPLQPAQAAIAPQPTVLVPAPEPSPRAVEAPRRIKESRPSRTRAIVVDPLIIEPITVPLIAVGSGSGVMPIEIEPLQIEPLQPQ